MWSREVGRDFAVKDVTTNEVACDGYDAATGRSVTRRLALATGQPVAAT
jgi:hypothetical protein